MYSLPLGDKFPHEIPAFIEVAKGSRNKVGTWTGEGLPVERESVPYDGHHTLRVSGVCVS